MIPGAYKKLPDSEKLREKYTFEGNFGGTVECFKVLGDGMIAVPRTHTTSIHDEIPSFDLGTPVNFDVSFTPRSKDQARVVEECRAFAKNGVSFIAQAPTGFGKTVIGVLTAAAVGRRFCILVNKDDLVDQWMKTLKEILNLQPGEVSIWRGNHLPHPDSKVVIALIQSVMKGTDRYPQSCYEGFGTVVCDEVHRMGADVFSQCMWLFPSKLRFGVSATPTRKDGKEKVFFWHIGQILVSAKMETLVPKILVTPTKWKVPRILYKNGKVGPVFHTYGMISGIMESLTTDWDRNRLIAGLVVQAYEKGRNTIIFSDQVEHLKLIAKQLTELGAPEDKIGWYVGTPSDVYKSAPKFQKEERASHKTKPLLLATYKMASEATDIPWLDTCILATPKSDVIQAVGRIHREYENKKEPVVFDLQDNASKVLSQYGKSRMKWYSELKCVVKVFQP